MSYARVKGLYGTAAWNELHPPSTSHSSGNTAKASILPSPSRASAASAHGDLVSTLSSASSSGDSASVPDGNVIGQQICHLIIHDLPTLHSLLAASPFLQEFVRANPFLQDMIAHPEKLQQHVAPSAASVPSATIATSSTSAPTSISSAKSSHSKKSGGSKVAGGGKFASYIDEAITALRDRNGSSRPAILKYITETHEYDLSHLPYGGARHHSQDAMRSTLFSLCVTRLTFFGGCMPVFSHFGLRFG